MHDKLKKLYGAVSVVMVQVAVKDGELTKMASLLNTELQSTLSHMLMTCSFRLSSSHPYNAILLLG